MYSFLFTKVAEKQFQDIEKATKERILEKLKFFKNTENISPFLKKVQELGPATHRLRV